MTKQPSVTILTGAGSVLHWGAPTTWQITEKIIHDREFLTISRRPVGEYLYNALTGFYARDPGSVNFETIVHLIEVLIDYYSGLETDGYPEYKSVLPLWLVSSDAMQRDLLQFSRIYKYKCGAYITQGKQLFLPSEESYFSALCRHFLNIIITQIENYALRAPTNLKNEFDSFLRSLQPSNIRYYTLNYDRLPVNASSIPFFDGFEKSGAHRKANIKRILSESDSDVYYNMHGSIHYKFIPFEWVCTPGASNKVESGSSSDHDQKGRRIIKSNIVTGLDKPSRILLRPQFEFYSRFTMDCLESDLVITIGYSFADPHVNRALETHRVNAKGKFAHITYMKDWITHGSPMNHYGPWDRLLSELFEGPYPNYLPHTEWIASSNGKEKVYWRGFESFLRNQEWINL